jgi:homoserine kinase
VAAADVEGTPSAAHLPLSRGLAFVVIVPDRPLVTAEARAVLPETLSRDDALFNLGRMGLLLAGLADPALLTPEATADRLHQNARATLFPEAPALLEALVQSGALASCWSGAGPSLLGIASEASAEKVGAGAQVALDDSGLSGRVLLRADLQGLVSGDAAELPSPPPWRRSANRAV